MNITNMLRKDNEIKWIVEAKKSFKDIKQAILEAHVLVSPNFEKYFLVLSYASKHPISFFSKIMRDGDLKYDIMEKQAYALVKALKDFRIYILHSHITAYVPNNMVKSIITQPDPEGEELNGL